MRNFLRPSLIMVSTFVVIHLIAYIVQFENSGQSHQTIQLKEMKVSTLVNIIQEENKTCLAGRQENKLEMSSIKYDISTLKIPEANKVPEKKALPSGEMTP